MKKAYASSDQPKILSMEHVRPSLPNYVLSTVSSALSERDIPRDREFSSHLVEENDLSLDMSKIVGTRVNQICPLSITVRAAVWTLLT